ncbi:MAG: beta-lactamase family protein [Rhodothermaceae bacterium]|nr:beta-lactamase family protein [Rhodothermaceae bacterium]
MLVRILAPAALVAALLAPPALGQASLAPSPPDSSYLYTPEGQILQQFLDAYNTGDRSALERFAATHYTGDYLANYGGPQGRADHWLNKFSQLGPLRFHTTGAFMGRPVAWLLGTVSQGWLGQILLLTDEPAPRVRGHMSLVGSGPPGVRSLPEPLDPPSLPGYLDAYLTRLASHDLFAGTVLVAKDGRTVFERSVGHANLGHDIPNHLDTRFALASLGKLFTAVGVLRLADEGALTLDDPLARFIPEYPEHIGRQVTIRHLLTHTSGIELDEIEAFEQAKDAAASLDELLHAHLTFLDSLENVEAFAPLDHFDYSNEGYDLLGLVVERASGMPYEAYIREGVFAPAGMYASGLLSEPFIPHLALGYYSGLGRDGTPKAGVPVEFQHRQAFPHPSGGHYSTAGDLLRFVNALVRHELLQEPTAARSLARQVVVGEEPGRASYYGLGFEIHEEAGLTSFGHDGAYSGISTALSVYPEVGYTVIVLSNYSFVAKTVARHLREVIASL